MLIKGNQMDNNEAFEKSLQRVTDNQPSKTTFEGFCVLRVKNSNFIGVPCTGTLSSKYWDVIDIRDRTDTICQLKKSEVRGWLCKRAIGNAN